MKSGKLLIILFICIIVFSSFVSAELNREDALQAISGSEDIMKEMSLLGFQVIAINDSIIESYYAVERADFAEVLRSNVTGELADQAREVLKGLDHRGFTYDAVMEYVDEIENRKERAYAIDDGISVIEKRINFYESEQISVIETKLYLSKTKNAFELERYSEAEEYLKKAFDSLDQAKADNTTVNVIVRSSQNFFYKHWKELSLVLFAILILSYFWWVSTDRKRLKRNIHKLELELISLKRLQKHIQTERFQKAKISQQHYLKKKDTYDNRTKEIEEQLPVLKKRLKREEHVYDVFHGKIKHHNSNIKTKTPKK